MAITLRFLGAARNVTGSRYLLDTGVSRLLIDSGLYQERDLVGRNWASFPVEPSSLNAVLLTHAHLDHCGYLPCLVRAGFSGPVFCTPPTAAIARIVLRDAARLQEEDALFKRRRHEREGRTGPFPVQPLYTADDAEACFPLLTPTPYGQPVAVGDGVEAVFLEAGHILGSAAIRLEARTNGGRRSIVFSGDIGRWDRPFLRDPEPCPPADFVVMESTYALRRHDKTDRIAEQLAAVIRSTRERGGNIVIPSFAIERAQEVLYYLNELLREDRVPHLMVFLDSPMAGSVIRVFEEYRDTLDEEAQRMLRDAASPFRFPGLKIVESVDDSKAINHIRGTVVILAGSGMCTGGRIKHHLSQNIGSKKNTILFVGYQARGTLGRLIVDGAPRVRILGQLRPVRARIEQIYGFSGHGDQDDLFRWAAALTQRPPQRLFVTHGEPEMADGMATLMRERLHGTEVTAPAYGEQVELI